MSSFISIHAPTWGATRKHFRKCHYHHISIHAPTWGATNSISMVLQISTNFNPRTHVGCDLTLFLIPIFLVNFNPRTHVGCDSGGHLLTCPTPHFNPRTHVGCDLSFLIVQINLRYFNPRTHVGCDLVIHKCLGHTQNFNPRTHVGCDFSVIYVLSAELYFNPRTHVGCDQVRQSLDFGLLISIHAPTWGATYSSLSSHESQSISIHAPTWGATHPPTICPAPQVKFQSTHPRGVRPPRPDRLRCILGFQSTHPRGVRRAGGGGDETTSRISIHAPTWGATCITAYLFDLAKISIHAPTWGATAIPPYAPTIRFYFNPRTHVGCDKFSVIDCPIGVISIHAPTWGATLRHSRRSN